jgi:hypothetical protein
MNELSNAYLIGLLAFGAWAYTIILFLMWIPLVS